MPFSAPIVPIELWRMVVDFLADDILSLLSCSLVSRSFVPLCQYWIFRVLGLNKEHETGFDYVKDFFDQSPHLALYVREISISGTPRGVHSGKGGAFCTCVLSNLLSIFRRAEVVSIGHICLACEPSCDATNLKTFAPMKVKTVDLWRISSQGKDASGMKRLFRLFTLFSEIQSVEFENIDIDYARYEEKLELAMMVAEDISSDQWPSIRHVSLQPDADLVSGCISYVFANTNANRVLESLHIVCQSWGDPEPTAALLKSTRTTLRTLHFDASYLIDNDVSHGRNEEDMFSYVIQKPTTWQTFQLSSCSSVTHFGTSVLLTEPRDEEDYPTHQPNVVAFGFMLRVILAGPQNIETLTICLNVAGESLTDILSQNYDWEQLRTVAQSPRLFPSLRLVDIVILTRNEIDEDEAEECESIVLEAIDDDSDEESEQDSKCVFQVSCEGSE